jgi:glycosyltransferase involved in cell wall biosynthesis
VCTSYAAHREPRGPRHARALSDAGNVALTFIDSAPIGEDRQPVEYLDQIDALDWHTLQFPLRKTNKLAWLLRKVRFKIARKRFAITGHVSNTALSTNLVGLEAKLVASNPDIIMAHNIDTLLPAYWAAQRCRAVLMFDSMEFHSDMGDEQDQLQMKLIKSIEQQCLPACHLVTTSSHRVAEALTDAYGVSELLPLYNTPQIEERLAATKAGEFTLYWRNSTIGLGQRGLEEGMRALALLPEPITLHLQGRPAMDGGESILRLARELGIQERLVIHPPYRAEFAIQEASRFHVGLCMERTGIRNHELTVSNKMFDYHMAGLAVVASDLPALRDVIDTSQAGLTYRPGDPESLAEQILRLHQDSALYQQLSTNARRFALQQGNLNVDMDRFRKHVRPLLEKSLPPTQTS